jgi:hypothetical protein
MQHSRRLLPLNSISRILSCQRTTASRASDVHLAPAWHLEAAAELLLTRIGAPTVESLAIVAEVVHGAPHRFADPARFSLAHGGKDRHPVPLKDRQQTGLALAGCRFR